MSKFIHLGSRHILRLRDPAANPKVAVRARDFVLHPPVLDSGAAGNLGTSLRRDARLAFWTVTLWRDELAMRAFRYHGPRLRAMPRLRHWCDEATYVHWQQDATELPDQETAYERPIREGIVSRHLPAPPA